MEYSCLTVKGTEYMLECMKIYADIDLGVDIEFIERDLTWAEGGGTEYEIVSPGRLSDESILCLGGFYSGFRANRNANENK